VRRYSIRHRLPLSSRVRPEHVVRSPASGQGVARHAASQLCEHQHEESRFRAGIRPTVHVSNSWAFALDAVPLHLTGNAASQVDRYRWAIGPALHWKRTSTVWSGMETGVEWFGRWQGNTLGAERVWSIPVTWYLLPTTPHRGCASSATRLRRAGRTERRLQRRPGGREWPLVLDATAILKGRRLTHAHTTAPDTARTPDPSEDREPFVQRLHDEQTVRTGRRDATVSLAASHRAVWSLKARRTRSAPRCPPTVSFSSNLPAAA